jgi:predicted dehydrogenase
MAIDLTPEQRQLGQENYARVADGMTRRRFMKGMAAAAGAAAVVTPAVYFGYEGVHGRPVKTGLIGAGDEGGVLVGEHTPEYLEFVAVADLRPYNLEIKGSSGGGRIFEGDPKAAIRRGFKKKYGHKANGIKPYRSFEQMLKENPEIEAVVIATPLVTHAPIAIRCMEIGKERGKPIHVLCEKLMARTIADCKQMIKTAHDTGSILSVGHQRHYSMLYAHAYDIINEGILGDIKHIRALWHRNFSWPWEPDKSGPALAKGAVQPKLRDGWFPPIYQMDDDELRDKIKAYGFESVDELIRWRVYDRTGGGLMAELGSHQMDACSIFLGKVHPLSVQGTGGKLFFGPGKNDRQSDDSIFVTFEFPGRNHPHGANKGSDKNDIVVVTYSSINTNGFENYGECVMGTRGTMIAEAEQKVFLFSEKDPTKKGAADPRATAVSVASSSGGPVLTTSGTGAAEATPAAGASATGGPAGSGAGPISRGYREEMEDFAYCVRLWDSKLGYATKDSQYQQRLPRCYGKIAMADAIIAMTANKAMKDRQRIEFQDAWFDPEKPDVPEKA